MNHQAANELDPAPIRPDRLCVVAERLHRMAHGRNYIRAAGPGTMDDLAFVMDFLTGTVKPVVIHDGHGYSPCTMQSGNTSSTFYRYFPVAKRDRDWGLFVTTIGESRFGAGLAYPPSGHPKGYAFSPSVGRCLQEYQIIYISAGRGWFKSKASGRVPVETGNVILLFPGVWHSYAPVRQTGWNEHWVGFNGDLARRLVRRGFFDPDRPVLWAGKEDTLQALFADLLEATRSNHPALQQILAGTTIRTLALLYSVQQSRLTGDSPSLQVIHQAVTRMREAAETALSVPSLARELNVSYRWFRRAFAQHTGLSPYQYLLDVRLARARELLAQSALSTKEIAHRVGFEDADYFCRLFHKKVGVPPGLWREPQVQRKTKPI